MYHSLIFPVVLNPNINNLASRSLLSVIAVIKHSLYSAILYALSAQLSEIRKFRYAKILCDNADYMPSVQPFVFLHPYSIVQEMSR